MQIGEELCDRYLKGDYQYVIAVHNDRDHLHCRIIFNNTNLYNGLRNCAQINYTNHLDKEVIICYN